MTPLPPEAEAVSVNEFPEHIVEEEALAVNVNAPGSVIVTVFVVVHPEASVTVTVLTPAFKPVMTEVVAPLDHR